MSQIKLTWFDPHVPRLAIARSPGSREVTLEGDLAQLQAANIERRDRDGALPPVRRDSI